MSKSTIGLKVLVKCCVCSRIKNNDNWDYGLDVERDTNMVSHGYCPECYETTMRSLLFENNGADRVA